MTDKPDTRVNLTEAANLTATHVELIVYPLDPTTLGLALAIDTHEFGKVAVRLSIEQAADIGKQCRRAAAATPQAMAALMRLITDPEKGTDQ